MSRILHFVLADKISIEEYGGKIKTIFINRKPLVDIKKSMICWQEIVILPIKIVSYSVYRDYIL